MSQAAPAIGLNHWPAWSAAKDKAELIRLTRQWVAYDWQVFQYPESSLRRAVPGALQHPKVFAPRTHGLPVLVGHNP